MFFLTVILFRSSVGAFDPLRLDIFESPWAKSKLDEVRNSSNSDLSKVRLLKEQNGKTIKVIVCVFDVL